MKFEIVGIDNKLSPQETLNALQVGHRPGRPLRVQGNGSGAAPAIIDAVNKHNERNPGKEVVYLNYAAVDPDLTNSKCSYWHFRLDADTSMKMEALTTFMKDQTDVKKVYLINQNYAHGHQVAQVRQGDPDAQAPRHPDRRRRPAPAGPGARLRALRRQDQGLGRRHRDHRQLGLRPHAADQGRQRRRPERQVLHLLRRRHRHAHRDGRERRRAACSRSAYDHYGADRRDAQAAWTSSRSASTTTSTPAHGLPRLRDAVAARWRRPRAPTRRRWPRRWKA